MNPIPEKLPRLVLPKRYERLRVEAVDAGIELASIVERVDRAASRIESLLRTVRDGGTGQFEVFYGRSGAGKTTFLSTLGKFFSGITIHAVSSADTSLVELADRIRNDWCEDGPMRLYFFNDRDNARVTSEEAEDFFEALRILFRETEGRVLVLWPMTRRLYAENLAAMAWEVGADSITAVDTRGLFEFFGLPKSLFFEVAHLTVKSLNGDSIEAFGVSAAEGAEVANAHESIGTYYAALERLASEKRRQAWGILQEKIVPKVWIAVCGDDSKYLDGSVARLTQGRFSLVDLDRVLDFLDDESNDAIYLQRWRNLRANAAYILRTLDVRIIGIPPNVALAAVRSHGEETIRNMLKQSTASLLQSRKTIRASQIYKAIKTEVSGVADAYGQQGRPPSADTMAEYQRIQSTARDNDKPLNHALGAAISDALGAEGFGVQIKVVTERRDLPNLSLQPDIQVWASQAEVICIEPTWRTSGNPAADDISKSQNSMTSGNVQKYFLGKVLDYIDALGLESISQRL